MGFWTIYLGIYGGGQGILPAPSIVQPTHVTISGGPNTLTVTNRVEDD